MKKITSIFIKLFFLPHEDEHAMSYGFYVINLKKLKIC